MPAYKLCLFGSPRLEQNGRALLLPGRKLTALLAYLAATAQPQSRDLLATLFWPEFDQSSARANLRRELSGLRNNFDPSQLVIEREQVRFLGGPDLWLDLAEFQSCLDECQRHPHGSQEVCPACLPLLQQATDLYTADFLAGFTLPACPTFDEWQFFQAEGYRSTLLTVLDRLAAGYARQNQPEAAIAQARRRLSLDPLQEAAQRQLITLYAETGNWTAAMRQADLCVQLLQDELGSPPDAETAALLQRLRARSVDPARRASQPENGVHRTVRHNLPTQSTAFIGRTAELAEIRRLLLEEAGCRLLTLAGPGGIGKTRLALAAAAQLQETFADGACFVALAGVSSVELIVTAIADALRFNFHGQSAPKAQLLDYLGRRQLLLVIDNFEHLLAGADLLTEILHHAPGVTLLTTARERLNLQEEWVYVVAGLAFPTRTEEGGDSAILPAAVSGYSAIALFLQRARQAFTGFTPADDELTAIVRICQLVEGMPLGLELAAPWVRTLSCREIAQEMQQSLDFLTTSWRNMPERHRSLRVVFEQSWQRLTAAEQNVLQGLSVFRGGCTRQAAEQVTGATLAELSALVDKALLRRTASGRYELHELIRQFAETQLQREPNAAEQVQRRYRDYFVTFLAARTAGVKGGKQKETVAEIKADIDNVRLVWRRAVANREVAALARMAECLLVFYLYSSGHYEGQSTFQLAADALIAGSDPPTADGIPDEKVVRDRQENLVAFLLAGQGYFLGRTRDAYAGQILVEQALALLRRVEPVDRHTEGFALLWLGWMFLLQGRPQKAQESVAPALTVLTETGDRWAEGWLLILWANALSDADPLEAEEVYKRGLAVCRQSGDLNMLGYMSQMRSIVNMSLGRYTQARAYIDEAVRAFDELGNLLGLGYGLQRRGELAISLGEYRQAIQVCHHAIAIFDEVRTEKNVWTTQINLARAHRLYGNSGQAEQIYRQLLQALTIRNEQWEIAHCLFGFGCLAYDQGKLQQAEAYQRQALAQYQQMGREVRVADVLRHLALVMIAAGEQRHTEARATFGQALNLALKHHLAPIALDVCVGVAQLMSHTGELEEAIALLSLACQHEASTFETKGRAQQRLALLLGQGFDSPKQPQDLWTFMQVLLTALQREDQLMLFKKI